MDDLPNVIVLSEIVKGDSNSVLPLLGYLPEGDDVMPSLVSESMEKGTLHDFMKSLSRGGIEACAIVRYPSFFCLTLYSSHTSTAAHLHSFIFTRTRSSTPNESRASFKLTSSHFARSAFVHSKYPRLRVLISFSCRRRLISRSLYPI